MKACPRCQKKLASKAGLKQHMDAVHNGAPQRSGRAVPAGVSSRPPAQARTMGSNLGDGSITLSRSELLASVEVASAKDSAQGYIVLLPSSTTMAWLFRLSSAYDQIVWHTARVFFKPASGTTRNGILLMGMDWNPAATDCSRTTVQSCTPVTESPVWQQSQLPLPASRLQSRKFYFLKASSSVDQAPGVLLWHVKTDTTTAKIFLGDLWIDYRVSLLGPSA